MPLYTPTFAGGRINATLRYALEAVEGAWKVVPDNFLIKLRGESVSRTRFEAALTKLREVEFWENEKLWKEVAESLPSYRLTKFQALMPPWVQREVVASYLLDVGGAWRWLSGDGRDVGRLPPVGLDVETSLDGLVLCLIQIAGATTTYLIDASELSDLEPLGAVLDNPSLTKVIHNADFEREVLGRQGFRIEPVIDTIALSREKHGPEAEGGHSLRALVRRELKRDLDKSQQASDWRQRPLGREQVEYAALDAEVLLPLCADLSRPSR
ncbi:MAG: hypothetical protein KA712_06060 [Myxococcales bacterium]|nr:hypothetical protein [Myxococcales bacterium]